MDYLITIDLSKEWGILARRIAILCEQNRINGVVKKEKHGLSHTEQLNLPMAEIIIMVNEVH